MDVLLTLFSDILDQLSNSVKRCIILDIEHSLCYLPTAPLFIYICLVLIFLHDLKGNNYIQGMNFSITIILYIYFTNLFFQIYEIIIEDSNSEMYGTNFYPY